MKRNNQGYEFHQTSLAMRTKSLHEPLILCVLWNVYFTCKGYEIWQEGQALPWPVNHALSAPISPAQSIAPDSLSLRWIIQQQQNEAVQKYIREVS